MSNLGLIYDYMIYYIICVSVYQAERLAAEDAETDRMRTKLRRESEWMAKQPKARQAKSKAREGQYYELVEKAKGRTPDAKAVELVSAEEKERQRRLGGVVAELRRVRYSLPPEPAEDPSQPATGGRLLLDDFSYSFRQRDRIGIVGPNGVGKCR